MRGWWRRMRRRRLWGLWRRLETSLATATDSLFDRLLRGYSASLAHVSSNHPCVAVYLDHRHPRRKAYRRPLPVAARHEAIQPTRAGTCPFP